MYLPIELLHWSGPGGVGLPTLLLALQLAAGLAAAVGLARGLARRQLGVSALGQAILAALLVPLGADGLFLGSDVFGRAAYELHVDPAWVRPGQIGLILVGTLLWASER